MRETVEWHRWNGELIRVRVEHSARWDGAPPRGVVVAPEIVGAWLFGVHVSAHHDDPRDQIGYWNSTFPQAFNLYNNPFPDPKGLAALRAEIVPADEDVADAIESEIPVGDDEWPPSDGPLDIEGSILWPLPRRER